MLPISNSQDKQTFKLILNYVKSGGNPAKIKGMARFCTKYQIDPSKLVEFMSKEEAAIMQKLYGAGLLN